MRHLESYQKYNESLLSRLTGNDSIAQKAYDSLRDLKRSDIKKEDDSPLCVSYSWEIYDDQILYNKMRIEVVKYTKTILLMVDDKEVRSSKWLREKVFNRVKEIYES